MYSKDIDIGSYPQEFIDMLYKSCFPLFLFPIFKKYTKEEFIKLSYNDIFRSDYRYHSIIKSKLIKCICNNRKIYLIAGGRQQERRVYSTLLQVKEDEKIANALIKLIEEN